MKPKLGLRQRMAKAKTSEELHALMIEARDYTNASQHTRQRWINTANRISKALSGK